MPDELDAKIKSDPYKPVEIWVYSTINIIMIMIKIRIKIRIMFGNFFGMQNDGFSDYGQLNTKW